MKRYKVTFVKKYTESQHALVKADTPQEAIAKAKAILPDQWILDRRPIIRVEMILDENSENRNN